MENRKATWKCKHFNQLSTEELYEIFRLRIEVFIVEQNCPYQDADGKDLSSYHLMGFDTNNRLIAYARIIPSGISYKEVSIGRVVSSPKIRRTKTGEELMQEIMQFIVQQFGEVPVRISAQSYLQKFYEKFGFVVVSDEYLEDNIPHKEMLYQLAIKSNKTKN